MAGKQKGCRALQIPYLKFIIHFDSRRFAAEYLQKEGVNLEINTITKKIGEAIRTGRPEFGYKWEEWENGLNLSEPELEEGFNLSNWSFNPIYEHKTNIPINNTQVDRYEERIAINAENELIKTKRIETATNAMGVQSIIYKNLPHYKSQYDLRKENGIMMPDTAILYFAPDNPKAYNDLGELVIDRNQILRRKDLLEIVEHNTLWESPIEITDEYKIKIQKLVQG